MKGTPTAIVCGHCGKQAMKELGHVNRAMKRGMPMYCNRECAAHGRRKRTPEQLKAYQTAYREAHREKARQRARERRAGYGRDATLASQRASYLRHRDKNLQRQKEWRENNYEKVKANIEKWLAANPEKKDLFAAKANLSQRLGVKVRDIPTDLALALVEQWKIKRWIKESSRK